jgi:hypothetical protein
MGRKKKVVRRSLVPVTRLDSLAYVDSIFLVLRQKMPTDMDAALTRSLDGDFRRRVGERVGTANDFYQFELRVHQPTRDTMRILEEATKAPIRARVVQVDVSLDLITKSKYDARSLQCYLEERLLPSMRLQTRVTHVKRTLYFNKDAQKGVEVVLYADRPSKVNRKSCLHMEWRVIGAHALRTANIQSAARIAALDFRKFFNQRVSLWRMPAAHQLVQVRRKRIGVSPENPATVAHCVARVDRLMSAATGASGVVVAHDLLYLLRWSQGEFGTRPQRFFAREPHNWLLPAKTSALWVPPA